MSRTYGQLKAEVQRLQSEGKVNAWPTDEERIDWAYGNSKIENDGVTREMAEQAVARVPSKHR